MFYGLLQDKQTKLLPLLLRMGWNPVNEVRHDDTAPLPLLRSRIFCK